DGDNGSYNSRAQCEAQSGQGSGNYDTCTWQDNNCDGDVSVAATALADSNTSNGHFNDYDMVVWDCEGSSYTRRTPAEELMLRNYANAGGRFFASHFSYEWLHSDAELGEAAEWGGSGAQGSG